MSANQNNFLTATSFKLQLDSSKFPNVNCAIQEFRHPSVSSTAAIQLSPRRDIPLPSDKMEFGSLELTLLLDTDLTSYITFFNWWQDCIKTNDKPLSEKTSDIRVSIFNNKNNVSKTINYIRAFPIEIGPINFDITDNKDDYLTFDVTLEFAYFDIT